MRRRTLLKLGATSAAVLLVAGGAAALLQPGLEGGFDAFANMRGANEFLNLIEQRETEWSRALFEDEPVTCETKLAHLLAASPSY